MKKVISLFLLIFMCVSMLTISVHAETQPTLTVGDLNFDGNVNSYDALLILQIITTKYMPPLKPEGETLSYQEKVDRYYYQARYVLGDVNNDGGVKSDDALLVLKVVVGKADGFATDDATQLLRYTRLPAWPGDVQ